MDCSGLILPNYLRNRRTYGLGEGSISGLACPQLSFSNHRYGAIIYLIIIAFEVIHTSKRLKVVVPSALFALTLVSAKRGGAS